jgi:hypothetical protein
LKYWREPMKLKLFLSIILLHFFSSCGISYANDYLKNILQGCRNDGSIKSVGFGDIKTKTTSNESESQYHVVKEYKNNEYYKTSEGYEKVWFYSTIQKNRSGETPKYVWHVIAIPSEIQHKYGIRGYMSAATINEAVQHDIITNSEKYYLIDHGSYHEYNGGKVRFYTNNSSNEATTKRGINQIWEKLLSHRNMNAVYFEINKEKDNSHLYYDFTFILYPVKANPDNINRTRGYLIPSSKLIKRKGKVYGLVLNEDNECVGHKVLVVR